MTAACTAVVCAAELRELLFSLSVFNSGIVAKNKSDFTVIVDQREEAIIRISGSGSLI